MKNAKTYNICFLFLLYLSLCPQTSIAATQQKPAPVPQSWQTRNVPHPLQTPNPSQKNADSPIGGEWCTIPYSGGGAPLPTGSRWVCSEKIIIDNHDASKICEDACKKKPGTSWTKQWTFESKKCKDHGAAKCECMYQTIWACSIKKIDFSKVQKCDYNDAYQSLCQMTCAAHQDYNLSTGIWNASADYANACPETHFACQCNFNPSGHTLSTTEKPKEWACADQPIWNDKDAEKYCPKSCKKKTNSQGQPYIWNGNWTSGGNIKSLNCKNGEKNGKPNDTESACECDAPS